MGSPGSARGTSRRSSLSSFARRNRIDFYKDGPDRSRRSPECRWHRLFRNWSAGVKKDYWTTS
jgi:hypothetical protein